MVVFLLLLILAVLLFGADAIKGFAFGLTKFAVGVLVLALVAAFVQGIIPKGWLGPMMFLGLFILLALGVAGGIIANSPEEKARVEQQERMRRYLEKQKGGADF